MIHGLDHAAIVVADSEVALWYFRDRLGLPVVAQDRPPPPSPAVLLTYLSAGPVTIQLVEPLDDESPAAHWLAEHGEGLHHLCFTADNITAESTRIAGAPPAVIGSGRGRPAAFLPGEPQHGVRIELTTPGDESGSG